MPPGDGDRDPGHARAPRGRRLHRLPQQGRTHAIPSNLCRFSSQRTPPLIAVAVAALATVAITSLLVNIFERKQEARNPFFRVVELTDQTVDPAIWGKNFPMQYDA
jgi:hypothetical protein